MTLQVPRYQKQHLCAMARMVKHMDEINSMPTSSTEEEVSNSEKNSLLIETNPSVVDEIMHTVRKAHSIIPLDLLTFVYEYLGSNVDKFLRILENEEFIMDIVTFSSVKRVENSNTNDFLPLYLSLPNNLPSQKVIQTRLRALISYLLSLSLEERNYIAKHLYLKGIFSFLELSQDNQILPPIKSLIPPIESIPPSTSLQMDSTADELISNLNLFALTLEGEPGDEQHHHEERQEKGTHHWVTNSRRKPKSRTFHTRLAPAVVCNNYFVLDLHGFTLDDAIFSIDEAISKRNLYPEYDIRRKFTILVITGSCNNKKLTPTLAPAVREHLLSCEYKINIEIGNEGCISVLPTKKRKPRRR